MVFEVPFSAEKVAALRARHENGEVVGLKEVSGTVPRLDIDVLLYTEPTCFNLFVLALQDLQYDPDLVKSKMGYQEIAGIHGLPKRPWNNIEHGRKNDDVKTPMGYCEHSSFKFPSWHRPYLMMIEQALYLQMVKRAQTFPDAGEQLKAVQKFRLPYWDYFRPRDYQTTFPGVLTGDGFTNFPYDFSVPQCLTVDRIIVSEPQNGKPVRKLIPNPLRSYTFPLENGLKDSDWAKLDASSNGAFYTRFAKGHTVRYGLRYWPQSTEKNVPKEKYLSTLLRYKNRNTRASQQGNDENLNLAVNMRRAQTLDNMAKMILPTTEPLKGYRSYENFATNRFPSNVNNGGAGRGGDDGPNPDQPAGSIEDFHNGWHMIIGSVVGHMGHPGIASFDPIFWFHHCNVDRYLALWQEVNPTAWFNERPNLAKEELLPFISTAAGNENGFWNSLMVKDTRNIGYEYPDIIKGDAKTTLERFKTQELWSLPSDKNKEIKAPADKMPLDLSTKLAFQGHPEYLPPFFDAPMQPFASQPVFMAKMATQQVMSLATTAIEKVSDQVSSSQRVDDPPEDDLTVQAQPQDPLFEALNHREAAADVNLETFLPMVASEIPVDWYIDVEVERLALNGPFGIYYFIGDTGGDIKVKPTEYDIAPTLAGVFYNFASPVEACDNCGVQADDKLKITGTTNISHILRDYVLREDLNSLEPDDVRPFLKDRLRWRVLDSHGEKSNPRTLATEHGLKLTVNSVRYVNDGSGPRGQFEPWADVTDEIINRPSAQAPMTDDLAVGLYNL